VTLGGVNRPDDRWFAVLVEALADAVAVVDSAGVLLYANPAADQLFGYPLAEHEGLDIFGLFHPEDLDLVQRCLTRYVDTDVAGHRLEVRVRIGDGQWVHVQILTTNSLADERFGATILAIREVSRQRTRLAGSRTPTAVAASSGDVREALEGGFRPEDVEVHYQPVVDTASGLTVGLEALARWRHPTLGLLRPGDFLAVAEEMGVVSALDWCVLERVAQDRDRWRIESPGLVALPVSVNISVTEVSDELEQRLDAFLASPGGAGTRLSLELTEALILRSAEQVSATLARLKDKGIGLTLDASVVGYSALPHLHQLPIRLLKLDRSFLASVANAGSEFTATFVELYAALDVHVVAVGVESFEQHQIVRSVGIKWAQGFFYAEPMPSADLTLRVTATAPGAPENSSSESTASSA
jgi:PAS domain S-box-containing protein